MKLILCLAILAAAGPYALAQCACDHCGCQASCQKVCRLVCETKKVPKVSYDCECQDFCVPGPSIRSTVCDECGHKRHVYTPQCGKPRTRTKMIKHETIEEKVVYKWVVENMCCQCAQKTAAAEPQQLAADTSTVPPHSTTSSVPALPADIRSASAAGIVPLTPALSATSVPAGRAVR
jgi:hypothetical protein